MEIVDLISYYIYEDTKRMEVSFRLNSDSEDEMRSDVINLDECILTSNIRQKLKVSYLPS